MNWLLQGKNVDRARETWCRGRRRTPESVEVRTLRALNENSAFIKEKNDIRSNDSNDNEDDDHYNPNTTTTVTTATTCNDR